MDRSTMNADATAITFLVPVTVSLRRLDEALKRVDEMTFEVEANVTEDMMHRALVVKGDEKEVFGFLEALLTRLPATADTL